MKTAHLLIILVLIANHVGAQIPNWTWAKAPASTSFILSDDIAVDSSGNSFITGHFENSVTFGSTTLTSTGMYDVFIVKYDPWGNVIWAKQAGGARQDAGVALALDGSGNICLTGSFMSSTITFGNITLTNADSLENIFLVKLDSAGTVMWASSAGGFKDDRPTGLAIDNNNNCLLTGNFSGSTTTFGSINLISNGVRDMFIAKYGANGNLIWAKSAGGTGLDFSNDIVTHGSGDSYITGYFYNAASFGATSLTSVGASDLFVAKYDAQGNVVWANRVGGKGADEGNGIAIDAMGNSYITGSISDTFMLGATQFASIGLNDFVLLKYNSSGTMLWAKTAGGGVSETGTNVAVDFSGNPYVTGHLYGFSVTFDTTTLLSKGLHDFFLVKYNPSGGVTWARSYGDKWDDLCTGIDFDASGIGYITGWFTNDSLRLGNHIVNNNPASGNMYIAKFCTSVAPSVSITQSGATLNAPTGFTSYQWFFNDNPIGGATGANHTPVLSGKYFVVVTTGGNACSGQSNTINVIAADIEDLVERNSIVITPNPNNGHFTVSSDFAPGAQVVTYEIRSMTGALVHAEKSNPYGKRFSKEMHLTNIPPGIYLLRATTVKGISWVRFVVE